MRSIPSAASAALVVLLAACSGTPGPDSGGAAGGGETKAPAGIGGGGGSSGTVVKPQPPGQGYASVDGLELTLTMPGGLACSVTDEEFAFSFIKDDNAFALGGGGTRSNGEWFGSMSLQLIDENGQTVYSAKLLDNPGDIAVAGNSVSYSGPMERTDPPPPGEIPQQVDVGDGVFSATCA